MVHKPKHKVHSFRGLLGDGGQDEINLERQNVNLAYRIVKFQLMFTDAVTSTKSVVMVWKEEQTTIDGLVDFNDTDMLAAAMLSGKADQTAYPEDLSVVFDNVLFSRNIYVTHSEIAGVASCNYYLEIEEVPVGAATLMQLKLGTARRLIGAKMGA